jgi:mediator of RNA polymerase II transcription subunit 6
MAGASTELPRVEDLTGTCWRDDVWFQTYGLLSHLSALDYFAQSPFYDSTSNNEVARQRGLRLEQLPQGAPGVEFILQDAQPPHLFVVRKQFRSLAGVLSPLAFYYILDGTIYQAPSLHAALSARIDRCIWTVKSAFSLLRSDLDPLGERGKEARGGEVAAEVNRLQATKHAAVQLAPEQRTRAERAVLATLLDHPLPVSVAMLKGTEAAAAVPPSQQNMRMDEGGVTGSEGVHPGVASGAAASRLS